MVNKSVSRKDSKPENAVLVAGGSGLIGRHLVGRLAASNRTVVSMYHHRLPEPMANVYPVCSDLGSVDLLAAPLRGVDTVVYLAWERNFVGPEGDVEFDPSLRRAPPNVRLLSNLLRAMEKAGSRRIIFVSACGADREAENPFLREKYIAEYAVLNSRVPEKMILRSSLVCSRDGLNDRFIRSVTDVMKLPGIYPVPDSKNHLSPVSLADLTECLYRLVHLPLHQKKCGIVELTGNERYRVRELFRLVSDRYSKGSRLQIRGFLGDSLIPLFEKNTKDSGHNPGIRHYLSLGHEVSKTTMNSNPLIEALPGNQTSFREILKEGT